MLVLFGPARDFATATVGEIGGVAASGALIGANFGLILGLWRAWRAERRWLPPTPDGSAALAAVRLAEIIPIRGAAPALADGTRRAPAMAPRPVAPAPSLHVEPAPPVAARSPRNTAEALSVASEGRETVSTANAGPPSAPVLSLVETPDSPDAGSVPSRSPGADRLAAAAKRSSARADFLAAPPDLPGNDANPAHAAKPAGRASGKASRPVRARAPTLLQVAIALTLLALLVILMPTILTGLDTGWTGALLVDAGKRLGALALAAGPALFYAMVLQRAPRAETNTRIAMRWVLGIAVVAAGGAASVALMEFV